MKPNQIKGNRFLFISLILILILFSRCSINKNNNQEFERWTSADPLAIHQRVRDQKYQQGNLIANNSFETGKIIEVDSLAHTTKIDGWDLIGKNVVWIHPGIDSILADSSEVHTGLCSVSIIRSSSSETEEFGQGVLSNFIKVIPGNYQLSAYIKLENIRNPKSRMGTGIFDAIDIRVLCYDRNKVQISGDFKAPYYNTVIDNSFKGLSFANFTSIDSTGWVHVEGRSHLFPFPDGDLQDETKFVRIFIGQKGTGSMWVDDISYQYTRWNFTMLERLAPYMDTTLAKGKMIVPLPRDVHIRESIIYYRPYYRDLFPAILISESADGVTWQAARLLENTLKDLLVSLTDLSEQDIPGLIKTQGLFQENEASIIFSLGATEKMKYHANELPLNSITDKKKGFFIYTVDELGQIIFLYGNSPEANYYAVETARQLFDKKRLLFHNAHIIDYPEKQDFGLLLLDDSDFTGEFNNSVGKTRFESIYIPYSENQIFTENQKYTSYKKWLYTACRSDISIATNSNRTLSGIDGVALVTDDFGLHNSIESIVEMFTTGIKVTNNEDCIELPTLIRQAKASNLDLEFMPSFHSNVLLSKALYDPLHAMGILNIPYTDLPVIWSGYQFQSWEIDEADLLFYRQFVKQPLVFFDYSMLLRSSYLNYFANDSVYPYKLLTASLFEPFSNEILPEVYEEVDKIVVVANLNNPFDRVRLLTASDYFWNPENYDPDLSLFRALVSEFGDKNAKRLVYLNDYYFKIRSDIILAQIQKNPHKYQRRVFSYLSEIHTLTDAIKKDPFTKRNIELLQSIDKLIFNLETRIKAAGLMNGE